MKHYSDVKEQAFIEIKDKFGSRMKKACFLWDLKGRLRFLFENKDNKDRNQITKEISNVLQSIAGPFWSGQLWVWSKDSSKAEKAVYDAVWKEAVVKNADAPQIKILDRYFSKTSWFSPQLSEPWELTKRATPILSFFSFKGGVGRTTALASLAVQLARSGKKVAVIDLDLEAPGVHSIFPTAPELTPPWGVVDYLLERPLLKQSEIDLTDYYYLAGDSRIVDEGPPITILPAGNLDDHYLDKLARIDHNALNRPKSRSDNEISPLSELLKQVRKQRDIDYFLLDSRAGLHDLGGLALSDISHLDVILGLDNRQSWQGMRVVVRFLGRNRIKRNQKQLDCAFVFALAPEPGEKREDAFQDFLAKSYDLFSEDYYVEEDANPDKFRLLPGKDDSAQPHYPVLIGFDPMVQRHQQIADIADRLCSGDYRKFADEILERTGRTLK